MGTIVERKVFLFGLPNDCQESTLKDFLEAVCDFPGTITKVSIPYKKTFAFVTLSNAEGAKHLLGKTLLYCDGEGQLYQVKACPYVKQSFRGKKIQYCKAKKNDNGLSDRTIDPEPAKYKSPDHVQQFTPDYSMLSLSKPKRKKRKRDDLTVWFSGAGSTSFRKRPRRKKKRQASRLEFHKSESYQFESVCPASNCTFSKAEDTTNVVAAVTGPVVNGNDVQGLSGAEEKVPVVEAVLVDGQTARSVVSSGEDILSSHTQIVIDHDYLGPLCLQFTSPPAVADVKNELLMRTGLPVKQQILYYDGKKLCDSLNLRCLLQDKRESLTLILSVGLLKGGVLPTKASDEGATGGKEDPSASQEPIQSMEMWDVENTSAWLCQIGLDEKYSAICREKCISGRSLLLLAEKSFDEFLSVFQLERGPRKIVSRLLSNLDPHVEAFNAGKPQTSGISEDTIRQWTVQELCTWLRKIGIPEESVTEVEKEEINGKAILLEELGELKKSLRLKVGSWVVLEHELFLLKHSGSNESDASTAVSVSDNTQSMPVLDRNILKTNEMDQTKEPLATSGFSTKSIVGTLPMVSKEDEILLLLQGALKLDIEAPSCFENIKECSVRSFFAKRGNSANVLEKRLNFIVITKDEMKEDKPRNLWSQIRGKTANWIALLTAGDSESFRWDHVSDTFVHVPTKQKVFLQDGKVGQMFLEKLSADEFKQNIFIALVDEQLLDENETITYNFSWDKKHRHVYSLKLNLEQSNYHASFDASNPGQDIKFSEHFKSLMTNTDASDMNVLHPPQMITEPSLTCDAVSYQPPRPFNSEFSGKYYKQGFVLNILETGPKDLLKPVHELKLLQKSVHNSDDDIIKKFIYETLRFACACLNERTNGTIHFGVADEVEGQTCGYQPREIVGSCITDKPRYNDKLTEFINQCFVCEGRSVVHNCIRPPVFIPVKSAVDDLPSDGKVVIEVDIEPRYSLCAKEVFEVEFKGLDRGKEEPRAFSRRGSHTYAIVKLAEMRDYVKNRLPKLDEERKKREREEETLQSVPKHDSRKQLFDKLKRLLCANKKALDSSIYPILVLSKPDTKMSQEFLNKTFRFIQNINWLLVIDFDDQGSENNGLFGVFKSGPESPQCDIHELEDYMDQAIGESVGCKTHWIFANGYLKLNKMAVGVREWNRSDRRKGFRNVVQTLAKKIPALRTVVLFLLFSSDYGPVIETFKIFCVDLSSVNQLVYVAENCETVTDWVAKLSESYLEDHEFGERGVVGMSWSELQVCMEQIIGGIDRQQRHVITATGVPYPLKNVSFSNIDIVSAKECEELRMLSSEERLELSSKVEKEFYRGYLVTWKNFWFTEDQKNHVLQRDNYLQLKILLEKLHSQGSEAPVQTVTIHHHIGAGASTMARQALWDFRFNSQYPYRCAVITKIDDSTCDEIFRLRAYGGGNEDGNFPPVLALVEDAEDFLFQHLHSQVADHANKKPSTEWPVCVFLYCKDTQKPRENHLTETKTSVFLEQHLSEREVGWFKDKYTEMEGKFHHKDPERDFETYANENLISFMIMKENFNPKYASSIVERNLIQVNAPLELTLLEYTSLLSLFNPFPVFASCFDTIMLSNALWRRKMFRDWVDDLSHPARIFLREKDVSEQLGTGKAITVVHPIIANTLLDKIAERKQTTVSEIAVNFLKSPLLENKADTFTSNYLYQGACRMLKHRKKYKHGDDIQTMFSPLIEKILYVKDADGKKTATEQTVDQAVKVLSEGLGKFNDPVIAQQMARVYYVNAAVFSKTTVESCFDNALRFCKKSIQMDPNSSFLLDTMGRIYQAKMRFLYGSIRKDNCVIEIETATSLLSLAFEAISWFQKSLAASVVNQNNYGFHGELSVMFYLLDVLRCANIFRGQEGLKTLQGYLAYCQVIPPEVQDLWSEFHELIKGLRNRFSHCMEGLIEDFTVSNREEDEIRRKQIASFKAQYCSYFGEVGTKWNTVHPGERYEYVWHIINQYLAGDIFSSVFSIRSSEKTPREALLMLRDLCDKNYSDGVHKETYKDLLLMISIRMALHSPHGNRSKRKSKQQAVEEYKEIYKFLEKLFAIEENDEGHKRLYAHLLKVMFLWPRNDIELSSYRVQDFYDSLKKLRERWEKRCKGFIDADKLLKQTLYKNITFKEQKRQCSALFYLGEGTGLDVFVHRNEKYRRTENRLKGVVEGKNIIRVQNPLEESRTIDIYNSSFREGRGFTKEEVSFVLGFSWDGPVAIDVKYTKKDHARHNPEPSDSILCHQGTFVDPEDGVSYDEYVQSTGKLKKKIQKIKLLKEMKENGHKLEDNQEKKILTEKDLKEKLAQLEKEFEDLSGSAD